MPGCVDAARIVMPMRHHAPDHAARTGEKMPEGVGIAVAMAVAAVVIGLVDMALGHPDRRRDRGGDGPSRPTEELST
jgi:hypothetical protein